MYTTVERVKELTGYDVDQDTIIMAQALIESYTGHIEMEVTKPVDVELMGHATAYQAAYISSDEGRVFEQMSAIQIMQFGQMVTFANDGTSPWIAPLAVLACKRASWHRIRSITTGPLFPKGPAVASGWRYE